MSNVTKQTVINALRKFARQRSGLDFANYGDAKAYRVEARSITRDLQHAETLLHAVEWRDSITADQIIEASKHAFSGRLSISTKKHVQGLPAFATTDFTCGCGLYVHPDNPNTSTNAIHCHDCPIKVSVTVTISYCTGQYFPTEYRRAVCAVLSSVLWDYWRDNMPESMLRDNNMRPGDYLRWTARQQFGRGIASRWFN